jgi:hypothetical protein
MKKLPSGNSASDSLSMLTRPFDACGRSGKPFAAGRMPSGSSPVSDCPAASVSRMVSVSVAATLLWRCAVGTAVGSSSGVKVMKSLLIRAR